MGQRHSTDGVPIPSFTPRSHEGKEPAHVRHRRTIVSFVNAIFHKRATTNKPIDGSVKKGSSLTDMGLVFDVLLSRGQFSRVYSATITKQNAKNYKTPGLERTKLAAKVIDRRGLPSRRIGRFFRREVNILKKLHHPCIIHVHGIWKQGRKNYIIMRLAEHGDLCNFIINHGPIKEPLIKIWTRSLTAALVYLHGLGIAHRDVKCDNILVTEKYNVKLADFGFSCYASNNKGHTLFASTDCGSLFYTAPEVIVGVPYNAKIADIWSLGVVVFVMLNGCFPFSATTLAKIYREQIQKAYVFTTSGKKHASNDLIAVIALMLEPVYYERLTLDNLLHSSWLGTKRPKHPIQRN